jgi:hypothetical protein
MHPWRQSWQAAPWSVLVILLDKAALPVFCTWPFILGWFKSGGVPGGISTKVH